MHSPTGYPPTGYTLGSPTGYNLGCRCGVCASRRASLAFALALADDTDTTHPGGAELRPTAAITRQMTKVRCMSVSVATEHLF